MKVKIRYIKAQIAGISKTIVKICNADVVNLGLKMRVHELIEVPLRLAVYLQALIVRNEWLSVELKRR